MTSRTTFSELRMLLLVCIFILTAACQDQDHMEKKEDLERLAQQLELYKKRTDSLQALIDKGRIAATYTVHFGTAYDSIIEPEAFIENALRNQPEQIPAQSRIGGTKNFNEVEVLTEDWVLGAYGDGPKTGQSIYQYRLQSDGTISFTHVTSKEPSQEEQLAQQGP